MSKLRRTDTFRVEPSFLEVGEEEYIPLDELFEDWKIALKVSAIQSELDINGSEEDAKIRKEEEAAHERWLKEHAHDDDDDDDDLVGPGYMEEYIPYYGDDYDPQGPFK